MMMMLLMMLLMIIMMTLNCIEAQDLRGSHNFECTIFRDQKEYHYDDHDGEDEDEDEDEGFKGW